MISHRFAQVIAILLFLTFVPALSHAQTVKLAEAQQQIYQKSRLSVEVTKIGGATASIQRNIFSASYRERRDWQAYQGFDPISEEEFFRIAGYEEEANKVTTFKREMLENAKRSRRKWGTAGLIGAALFVGGALLPQGDTEGGDSNALPIIMMVVGAPTALIGGIGAMFPLTSHGYDPDRKWAPYATVEGIADQHNRRLLIQIQKRF